MQKFFDFCVASRIPRSFTVDLATNWVTKTFPHAIAKTYRHQWQSKFLQTHKVHWSITYILWDLHTRIYLWSVIDDSVNFFFISALIRVIMLVTDEEKLSLLKITWYRAFYSAIPLTSFWKKHNHIAKHSRSYVIWIILELIGFFKSL